MNQLSSIKNYDPKNLCTKVIQINLRHAKTASVELAKRIHKSKEIGLVSEPWIHRGLVKGLDQLKSLCKGPKPRAAIVAPNQVKVMFIDDLSDEDLACASVQTSQGLVYLVSAYWDINITNPFLNRLKKTLDVLQDKKAPIIIGMDSNAHSTLWGCRESNVRGQTLGGLS